MGARGKDGTLEQINGWDDAFFYAFEDLLIVSQLHPGHC